MADVIECSHEITLLACFILHSNEVTLVILLTGVVPIGDGVSTERTTMVTVEVGVVPGSIAATVRTLVAGVRTRMPADGTVETAVAAMTTATTTIARSVAAAVTGLGMMVPVRAGGTV